MWSLISLEKVSRKLAVHDSDKHGESCQLYRFVCLNNVLTDYLFASPCEFLIIYVLSESKLDMALI